MAVLLIFYLLLGSKLFTLFFFLNTSSEEREREIEGGETYIMLDDEGFGGVLYIYIERERESSSVSELWMRLLGGFVSWLRVKGSDY